MGLTQLSQTHFYELAGGRGVEPRFKESENFLTTFQYSFKSYNLLNLLNNCMGSGVKSLQPVEKLPD
jgi:hypothetical protein